MAGLEAGLTPETFGNPLHGERELDELVAFLTER